jgi:hypothetical protein
MRHFVYGLCPMKGPAPIEDVLAIMAAKQRRPSQRSPLSRYLWVNRAEIAKAIDTDPNWSWEGFAEALGEKGIRDRSGNVPTVRAVRLAWGRTLAAVAAKTKPSPAVEFPRPRPDQTPQPTREPASHPKLEGLFPEKRPMPPLRRKPEDNS